LNNCVARGGGSIFIKNGSDANLHRKQKQKITVSPTTAVHREQTVLILIRVYRAGAECGSEAGLIKEMNRNRNSISEISVPSALSKGQYFYAFIREVPGTLSRWQEVSSVVSSEGSTLMSGENSSILKFIMH